MYFCNMIIVTGAAGFIGSCLVSKLNSLGKTIFSVKKKSISTIGTYKESLDISRLESGMYFLNVSSTSNTETLKFVVSH